MDPIFYFAPTHPPESTQCNMVDPFPMSLSNTAQFFKSTWNTPFPMPMSTSKDVTYIPSSSVHLTSQHHTTIAAPAVHPNTMSFLPSLSTPTPCSSSPPSSTSPSLSPTMAYTSFPHTSSYPPSSSSNTASHASFSFPDNTHLFFPLKTNTQTDPFLALHPSFSPVNNSSSVSSPSTHSTLSPFSSSSCNTTEQPHFNPTSKEIALPKESSPRPGPKKRGRPKSGTSAQYTQFQPSYTSLPPLPSSFSTSRGLRSTSKKPPRVLLSTDIKKKNHIASEQKRRQNIRLGFDRLVDLVPGLQKAPRSESLILQKSIEYIQDLLVQHRTLKTEYAQHMGYLTEENIPIEPDLVSSDEDEFTGIPLPTTKIRTYRRSMYPKKQTSASKSHRINTSHKRLSSHGGSSPPRELLPEAAG